VCLKVAERHIRSAAVEPDIRRAAEYEGLARSLLSHAADYGWEGDVDETIADHWTKYGSC
jgi:hypothetical protein